MEITPSNIYGSRSRSRSRTRNSTANSRSTSSSRRPSLGPRRRSLSSSSLNRLVVTNTNLESQEKAIPTTTVSLDNTLPIDFFKQDLISLIKALKVSKWHKHNLELVYISVSRISGALTNSIYKLEYKDHSNGLVLPSLLLRIYGKNVDSIIDRESELRTLIKLSQKKIGPRLLGIFANGRFEQFLEGFITLNKDQIRDEVISQMIGRRMKELHYKINLEVEDLENELPMCWRLIYKWLDLLEEQLAEAKAIDPNFTEESVFFMKYAEFREIIENYKDWLFGQYDSRNFGENYRFCHNDTQYGNLLLHESFNPNEIVLKSASVSQADIPSAAAAAAADGTESPAAPNASASSVSLASTAPGPSTPGAPTPGLAVTTNKKDNSLVVIDFEYGGSNFPAFDLVNHFSEWMSDYHNPEKSYFIHNESYPTRLEQLNLIKSYVEYDFQFPSSNLKTSTRWGDLSSSNATEIIEFEIKKLYNECIIWRPAVQIYWTLWGLIQNGPLVKPPPSAASSSKEEAGVTGKYSITTEMESLQLGGAGGDAAAASAAEDANVEDITSSDDDFDYLKYSQQKLGLILGDVIQFGVFPQGQLNKKHESDIKWLNTELFEV